MTLSEKILRFGKDIDELIEFGDLDENTRVIPFEDVKEFIKKLKEEFEEWGLELQELQKIPEDNAIRGKMKCPKCREYFGEIIDKLAGEELTRGAENEY